MSLLPAGVTGVKGSFEADEAVEIAGPDGGVFAKGLCRLDAAGLREVAGRRTSELPEGVTHEVVHRDDLVVLPRATRAATPPPRTLPAAGVVVRAVRWLRGRRCGWCGRGSSGAGTRWCGTTPPTSCQLPGAVAAAPSCGSASGRR